MSQFTVGKLAVLACKRCAEQHARYIRLEQPEKSGLAEHCLENNHTPPFDLMQILSRTWGLLKRMIMESIEIHLSPLSVNTVLGIQPWFCI